MLHLAASPSIFDNSLWLMVGAALVLLMTPGVAFFYGGMVKAKSVISMMMMSFGAIALVGVLWVIYGYSMSFSSGKDWWWPHVLAILWQALWVALILRMGSQLFRKTVLKSGPRMRWWKRKSVA